MANVVQHIQRQQELFASHFKCNFSYFLFTASSSAPPCHSPSSEHPCAPLCIRARLSICVLTPLISLFLSLSSAEFKGALLTRMWRIHYRQSCYILFILNTETVSLPPQVLTPTMLLITDPLRGLLGYHKHVTHQ